MICPIMSKAYPRTYSPNSSLITETGIIPAECRKEECAWWDAEIEKCIVPIVALDLGRIRRMLRNILASGS